MPGPPKIEQTSYGRANGRAMQSCQRPDIGQAGVSGVAGQHDLLRARRTGDRWGGGVVLAGFAIGEAVRVVAELGQHPGAENVAEAGP